MDFPAGPMVKNLPANVKDTGSIPGPGRSHMPWGNEAWMPQLLSPCSLAPCLSIREATAMRSPCTTTRE